MATRKTKPTKPASVGALPRELQPLAFPIDRLKLDPRNARTHDERNLAAVEESLRRYGWRGVVVVRKADNVILAGNARIEAAKRLGWTEAPVLFVADDKGAAAAYAIADNRTAELADWDLQQLSETMKALSAVSAEAMRSVGFSDDELSNLLAAEWEPDEDVEDVAVSKHNRQKPSAVEPSESSTIMLTAPQFEVVMHALAIARRKAPKLTLGSLIASACKAFASEPSA
jgi:hypothetical protein